MSNDDKKGKKDPFKKIKSKKTKTELTKEEKRAQLLAELADLDKEDEQGEIDKAVDRAVEILEIMQGIKPLYEELDEIIEMLLLTDKSTFENDDAVLVLVDNFAKKNKAWKSVPFTRFSLDITLKKDD